MKPIPLVEPAAIHRLVAFRVRVGGGLRLPVSLGNGNGPLPLAYAGRLFEDLAHAVGEEGVGLSVGRGSRFEDAPLGRDVSGLPTIGAALAAGARESARYCAGQRLWVTQRGGDVWLQRRFPDTLRRGRRQANDFALQILIDLVRRGAGPRWQPSELHLEGTPPGHAEELAALAAGSTHFGAAADCLVFPRSVLALPLPLAPRPVGPASPPLPGLDFVGSVRETIRYLLSVGELTLPNVAEAAGMSTRSLQRRLAASGLAFARLVDDARFRAASRLLRDPSVRITDVSIELGYSEAASFTRAFRRWAGVSPLAFRRAAGPQLDAGAG